MSEVEAGIRELARTVAAAGPSAPRYAPDPVSMPVIRAWTEAIGDRNPRYAEEQVAPPAMLQVWTMPGLHRPASGAGWDPLGQMTAALDAAGYTAVVATNCNQEYYRYLRHGELLAVRSELADVTGPKQTALGEGWFVTTRNIWYSADEPVGSMEFRVLKFRATGQAAPAAASAAAAGAGQEGHDAARGHARPRWPGAPRDVLRPPRSPDTEFFWAGTATGQLRIQRCGKCGALRHPPGPGCLSCGATEGQEYQVAAGTGTVYSYVVHHRPPVPGRQLPIVVALVELTEGVRLLGELRGIPAADVAVGLPVRVAFDRIDDELTLPYWRPATPDVLPELRLAVTPTMVVASALATRDFYPVHHDRDAAVASGSQDIFLNILTTTGLVQRYVTDWAGPDAVVRALSIRLGAPCYAGDTLVLAGRAADGGVITVTGRCSLGDHVTGTVTLA